MTLMQGLLPVNLIYVKFPIGNHGTIYWIQMDLHMSVQTWLGLNCYPHLPIINTMSTSLLCCIMILMTTLTLLLNPLLISFLMINLPAQLLLTLHQNTYMPLTYIYLK